MVERARGCVSGAAFVSVTILHPYNPPRLLANSQELLQTPDPIAVGDVVRGSALGAAPFLLQLSATSTILRSLLQTSGPISERRVYCTPLPTFASNFCLLKLLQTPANSWAN